MGEASGGVANRRSRGVVERLRVALEKVEFATGGTC